MADAPKITATISGSSADVRRLLGHLDTHAGILADAGPGNVCTQVEGEAFSKTTFGASHMAEGWPMGTVDPKPGASRLRFMPPGTPRRSEPEHITSVTVAFGATLSLTISGREISIGMATPEQAKRAAELTFGALTTFFKEMQGSFKDVMEFSKVAAPSSNMLKVPEHFMFAEEAVLSQQGIRGEVAGTAVAGFNRRLINRTAKSRAAMAEAGLHYADYVDVDPSRITVEGVLDAFKQRAGTADAATQARIRASVEAFQRDRDLDKWNVTLTDSFMHSGNKGLQNRVAASNAAGDITQGSIAAVDQLKFLQDVKDKNVGFGLLQPMFREATNAVLLMAQNVDELKRIKGVYDKADNQQTYDAAKKEQFDNYAGAQQNFHGAISGVQDQLFQPLEGPLTHAYNMAAEGIRSIASAGEGTKAVLDAVLIAGTAIGGLKTAGTLAEMAGGLMKLATGAEAAGPLVGSLALLADIPFIPIVAGIAAVVGAFEAFQHRAELWSAFDAWKHGGTEAPALPTTPEDAGKLRARLAYDRDAVQARRAELDRNLPIDITLERLQQRLDGFTKLSRIDQAPGVQAAMRAREAAERERPQTDPDYTAARDRLRDVEAQLKRRDAIAAQDRRVQTYDHVIEHINGEDASARDAELPGLRARRAELKAKLPHGVNSSPAVEALDAQIIARLQANEDLHRRSLEIAGRMRDDALRAAGAPDVKPSDLDAAMRAKDDAMVRAQQRHDSELEKAKADVARARLDAEAAIRQTPEVKEVQAQVDARRDELRAKAARNAGADGKIRDLEADIARQEAALTAYERMHPAFTRMGVDGRPITLPDFSKASVPPAGLAFGLQGPTVETPEFLRHLAQPKVAEVPAPRPPAFPEAERPPGRPAPALEPERAAPRPMPSLELERPRPAPVFLNPEYAPAALRPSLPAAPIAPAAPAQPQRVDVGVTGTVTGQAELHSNVNVQIQPSTYLAGRFREFFVGLTRPAG